MEQIQETPTAQPAAGHSPKKWSWGAFMFDPVFLVAIKRYALLWWYLLLLVPFVNSVAWLVLKIYFGIKGHQMLAASTAFTNDDQRHGFMNAFDRAGKVFFWVTIILIVISLIFASFVGLSALFGLLGTGAFDSFDYQESNGTTADVEIEIPEGVELPPEFLEALEQAQGIQE